MHIVVIPPYSEDEEKGTPCPGCGSIHPENFATIKEGKRVKGKGHIWCGWGSGFHLYGENNR
jgi:hypothetical protein